MDTMNKEKKDLIEKLIKEANYIRRYVVKMSFVPKVYPEGYKPTVLLGGALSVADIIAALYFHFLNVDPKNPLWKDRDRFILSKGHVAVALYSALAKRGFFPVEELSTFEQLGSRLGTHPGAWTPGVDWSTGSLGHGLPSAVGMAIAGKCDHKSYKTYVVLGDGELGEGSNWEAAMAASSYKLDNLIAITDRNWIQADDFTENVLPLEPLAEKWRSFGWAVKTINGNDMEQIVDALENVPIKRGKPTAIIASTVKGKGVSFVENQPWAHHYQMNEEEYKRAMTELGGEKDA